MDSDERNEEIGQALRDARKRRGWTQAEASKRLGTHATQVARYELGQREAPLSFIRRAEAAYGVPILPAAPSSVSRETPSGGVVRGAERRHGPGLPISPPLGALHLDTALWAIESMHEHLASMMREVRASRMPAPFGGGSEPSTADQIGDAAAAGLAEGDQYAATDRPAPREA
jgi:transcriptional regulator with XRE-family HTH domain